MSEAHVSEESVGEAHVSEESVGEECQRFVLLLFLSLRGWWGIPD